MGTLDRFAQGYELFARIFTRKFNISLGRLAKLVDTAWNEMSEPEKLYWLRKAGQIEQG